MKHKSHDVTAATNPQHMPPTHYINTRRAVREPSPTPARRPPVTPPTPVSGVGAASITSRETPRPTFELPDKVSQADIRDNSFKYGGGRSAGNRSLQSNTDIQRKQQ
jgi:hypothetical protein